MSNPLVSIIIPVYNAEKYIDTCIQSALNQTWQNKEIIIIDDGSTDLSLTIAKKFESELVQVFTQSNRGASAARNLGLSYAKGDYIQFLDADDLISLDKIENQVKLALKNPNHIVGCQTIHFFDGREPRKMNYINDSELIFREVNPIKFIVNLWGGKDGIIKMVQPNSWLTPISIIQTAGFWNEALTLDDDGEYFCRVILSSEGVIFDDKCLNYYRKYVNSQSISGGMNTNSLLSQAKALSLKKEQLFQKTHIKEARVAVANLYLSLSFISYKKDNFIFSLATNELNKINVKPNLKIDLGGKVVNFLGVLLGWQNARAMSIWKNKFVKSKF